MDSRIQLAFHIVSDPSFFFVSPDDPDERQPKTRGSPSRCLILDPERKLLAGEWAEISTPRSSVRWTRALFICLSYRVFYFFYNFKMLKTLVIPGVKIANICVAWKEISEETHKLLSWELLRLSIAFRYMSDGKKSP